MGQAFDDIVMYQWGNTYKFYWSETNDGIMYDVYLSAIIPPEDIENHDSDDGGLCTGSLYDAMGMAGIEN